MTITAKPIVAVVGGVEYPLVPSISAVRAINDALGGLRGALTAVQNLNYDAAALVINAGSGGKMKFKQLQALGEALWQEEDRSEALGAVVEYLAVLLNGGRPVEAEKGASEGN